MTSDPRDLVTVCTATMADSCGHLNRMMLDLRAFTNLPFQQIVSDDGTIDDGQRDRQRRVTESHGARWTENPGPTYGISYNWNHLLEQVTTPWAFCVEDGLRASRGWLETAVDALERIGSRTWRGYPVGMMGCLSFEEWHLAMAGALPTQMTFLDFYHRQGSATYGAFWGSADHPNWNDGLWCWKRLLPALHAACSTPEAQRWPEPVGYFRDVVLNGMPPPEYRTIGRCPAHSWPGVRRAGCAWFPGAFALVNMEAWRAVGKFRDGCTFFEGHFGIRLALAGWLSLYLEFPPWLHFPSMGFSAALMGRKPRHHEPCDGPGSILERDFGCNGPGHSDLYALVASKFPREVQDAVEAELAGVELYMDPAWQEWV